MAASTYFAQVQQLYIAYFGRPADPTGQAYWAANIDAAKGDISAVIAGFSASKESADLFGNKSTIDKVTAIYQNAFGRAPEPAGLAYWVAQLDSGKVSQAQASWTIQQNAGPGDAAAVQNKLTAAQAFTAQIDTTAEIAGYQGADAAQIARDFLKGVTADNATATAAVAAAAAAVAAATAVGNVGSTTVLTANIDVLTGTSGNDVFIGSPATTQSGDQINGGAGTDTFKFFADAATTTLTLPQLNSVENLYVNGGQIAAVNVAGVAGLTGVEIDKQGANLALTLSGAQTAKLSNNNGATVYTETLNYGATDAAANIVLNGVGKAGAAAAVTVEGAALATLNINSAGTVANNITLANAAAQLATLNISGSAATTVAAVAALNALKTVNASTSTGGVTFDQSALGTNNQLTFTGGAGNDKVIFKAGFLTAGAAGDVLDGGAGIDTLVINDTAPVYAAINAAKNFEILGLNTTGATVDISQITNGINQFAVGQGNLTETFTNSLSTTKFTIDNTAGNSGTVSIANKVGETGTSITLDNQSATAKTLTDLTLTGVTNVALASTGKAGNIIGTLNNADNSNFTVTGSADLTLALKAVAIGSKVDGSAATGSLNLTGNNTAFAAGSSLGDTLIGGSKADVLKASVNGGTLTGNGGNDTFDVTAAHGGTAATAGVVNITDLTKGDMVKFTGTTFATAKVDVSSAANLAAALDMLASGATVGAVKWGVFQGNTYVVDDQNAAATFSTSDTVVKLAGVVDLSTSTFAANTLTFA